MAIERITSADILKMNNSEEIIGIIEEIIVTKPELDVLAACPVSKTFYNTLVRTALPPVAFRETNTGREEQKSTLTTSEVRCKFLDASWSMDKAVALECEWGVDAALTMEASGALESAFNVIAKQTWYGTSADAGGFIGISSLLGSLSNPRVLNVGGNTANSASSIYAVCTSPNQVAYAWGQNGVISSGSIESVRINDTADPKKIFWGYAQDVSAWVGLQIPTTSFIARACNITEAKPATDSTIAKLLQLFPAARKPNALFMSAKTLEQIRAARTATNETGREAPYPTEIFGVPIYVSEAIVDTETIVTAA